MNDTPASKPRLLSLDVFRGGTVAAMILVNNPGSWDHVYWPLEHAPWHGCTPTDLVMPFFLFIVGVSIVYAFDSKKLAGEPRPPLYGRILRRAGILFALGLLLALFPGSPAALDQLLHHPVDRLAHLRIMGVLQRIALVYAACSVAFLHLRPRGWAMLSAAILLLYWAALTLVSVPQSAATTLPTGPHLAPDSNLPAYLDRLILHPNHLYRGGPLDPEGVLSTFAAIATGLLGLLAGHHLKRAGPGNPHRAIANLCTAGLLGLAAAWLWSLALPFNKQLWTSSYTLHTAALATLTLALCYHLLDLAPNANARQSPLHRLFVTPLVAFGVNAITAFVASGLMVRAAGLIRVTHEGQSLGLKDYLYTAYLAPRFANPDLASFIAALLFLGLWTAIVLLMHRRGWIIKV